MVSRTDTIGWDFGTSKGTYRGVPGSSSGGSTGLNVNNGPSESSGTIRGPRSASGSSSNINNSGSPASPGVGTVKASPREKGRVSEISGEGWFGGRFWF